MAFGTFHYAVFPQREFSHRMHSRPLLGPFRWLPYFSLGVCNSHDRKFRRWITQFMYPNACVHIHMYILIERTYFYVKVKVYVCVWKTRRYNYIGSGCNENLHVGRVATANFPDAETPGWLSVENVPSESVWT